MSSQNKNPSRRDALALAGGAIAASHLPASAQGAGLLARKIPSTGEMLPCVGIGTAIIFDFENDPTKTAERTDVIKTLVAGGGKLIDTAPSYGKAEERVGDILKDTGLRDRIFLATKVAVGDRAASIAEMQASLRKLKTERVELMQLHNVRDGNQSLALLREWKTQGVCKYIGVTSSFDRDYAAVEACVRKEKPDFFQIDYSLVDRNSEERLIPTAADAGCAILTNRNGPPARCRHAKENGRAVRGALKQPCKLPLRHAQIPSNLADWFSVSVRRPTQDDKRGRSRLSHIGWRHDQRFIALNLLASSGWRASQAARRPRAHAGPGPEARDICERRKHAGAGASRRPRA
jgi:diketogulonate reductase-like aldo/keto reductase